MSLIAQPIPPWILRAVSSFGKISAELQPVLQSNQSIRLIVLNGSSMQTSTTFYDELAVKLQLPNYFGRNLNALDECLCDLEWLHSSGFVLLIQAAQDVLRLETTEKLDGFLDVLNRAGEEWSRPVVAGESWDRGPIPFHSIFQCDTPSWRNDLLLVGS